MVCFAGIAFDEVHVKKNLLFTKEGRLYGYVDPDTDAIDPFESADASNENGPELASVCTKLLTVC